MNFDYLNQCKLKLPNISRIKSFNIRTLYSLIIVINIGNNNFENGN